MDEIKQKIKEAGFKGELDNSLATLQFYSHDASLFEIMPKLVVFPIDRKDVMIIVKVVSENKGKYPKR